MYPLSPKFPSHPGCHVTLSRVPCAIQQDLVGYPFYFLKLFIYFWLFWVFVAAHRLSLVVMSRGYSLLGLLKLLVAVASLVAERRVHRLQ